MVKIIFAASAIALGFTQYAYAQDTVRVRARLKNARSATRSAKAPPTKSDLSSTVLTGAKPAVFPISTIPIRIRIRKLCGTMPASKNTSKIRPLRCLGLR